MVVIAVQVQINQLTGKIFARYSVSHIITYLSKELCSKIALGEVGVSPP